MEAPFSGKVFDVKLIPEFDGSSQPVLEWHEKLELVCELCGIADIAHVLPLRLTAGALAVYQQLASEDRKNVERIREALIAAFALDGFAGHKQVASTTLNMGKSHMSSWRTYGDWEPWLVAYQKAFWAVPSSQGYRSIFKTC
ncbi:hypothetical protein M513_13016 [Trichuris suis]|uniref:Uncharacterized protein n=1 Tax=Trichuris suis TaxID=68888 RepID=A0A085LMC5_9BILA|nr:hypothetical protein M513_13016 [Trichuris suis]